VKPKAKRPVASPKASKSNGVTPPAAMAAKRATKKDLSAKI
jgi:hypothetical protein